MKPKKGEICWAVWNPRLGIYFHTVTDTRSCAIADRVSASGKDWKWCRRRGDRAVKVRIEVLNPTTKGDANGD